MRETTYSHHCGWLVGKGNHGYCVHSVKKIALQMVHQIVVSLTVPYDHTLPSSSNSFIEEVDANSTLLVSTVIG